MPVVPEPTEVPPHVTTRVHTRLRERLDAPPTDPTELHLHDEHRAVLAEAEAATAAGEVDYFRELRWELAALRLQLPEARGAGSAAELYNASVYELDETARTYLRRRVRESDRPALRVRYVELLLFCGPTAGREWIESARDAVRQYRGFADAIVASLGPGADGFAGAVLAQAVQRAAPFAARGGVLDDAGRREWVAWTVALAQRLAALPWDADEGPARPFDQHRWPYEVVGSLTAFRAELIAVAERDAALALVGAAYDFFAAKPESDLIAVGVAKVDAQLRRHFGEAGAAVTATLLRRTADAPLRRADVAAAGRQHMAEAIFVRQALETMEAHKELFAEEERAGLRARERAAHEALLVSGELEEVSFQQEVDPQEFDMTAGTPHDTLEALVDAAHGLLPDQNALRAAAEPLASGIAAMLTTTVHLRGSKVVDTPRSEEERVRSEASRLLVLHGQNYVRLYLDGTLRRSHEREGLRPSHLVTLFRELAIDGGTATLLECGYERYFAGDFVSAAHILVPRVEDVVRAELRRMGIEGTTFQPGDATASSRTDDATFGAFLRRTTADGRTAQDILGAELYAYLQTLFLDPAALNLRNEFAHGLARPADCNPATVAIVSHVLLCLVSLARSRGAARAASGT